jgi:hypothetical protein
MATARLRRAAVSRVKVMSYSMLSSGAETAGLDTTALRRARAEPASMKD